MNKVYCINCIYYMPSLLCRSKCMEPHNLIKKDTPLGIKKKCRASYKVLNKNNDCKYYKKISFIQRKLREEGINFE